MFFIIKNNNNFFYNLQKFDPYVFITGGSFKNAFLRKVLWKMCFILFIYLGLYFSLNDLFNQVFLMWVNPVVNWGLKPLEKCNDTHYFSAGVKKDNWKTLIYKGYIEFFISAIYLAYSNKPNLTDWQKLVKRKALAPAISYYFEGHYKQLMLNHSYDLWFLHFGRKYLNVSYEIESAEYHEQKKKIIADSGDELPVTILIFKPGDDFSIFNNYGAFRDQYFAYGENHRFWATKFFIDFFSEFYKKKPEDRRVMAWRFFRFWFAPEEFVELFKKNISHFTDDSGKTFYNNGSLAYFIKLKSYCKKEVKKNLPPKDPLYYYQPFSRLPLKKKKKWF